MPSSSSYYHGQGTACHQRTQLVSSNALEASVAMSAPPTKAHRRMRLWVQTSRTCRSRTASSSSSSMKRIMLDRSTVRRAEAT